MQKKSEQEEKDITVRVSKMPDPQSDDVEETVDTPEFWEEIGERVVDVVEMLIIGLAMGFSIWGLQWLFDLYDLSPESFTIHHPHLATGIAFAVFSVVIFLNKLRAASRTGVNGDSQNGDTAEVVEARHDRASVGGDGAEEHGIVQPTIPTPPAVMTVPSSSSLRSGDGVVYGSAGSGVVTAADVELGRASHHRRGERERGVGAPGEPVGDKKGKNA